MAKDNKVNMPSGSSGLMRYFDSDYPSKIRLKAGHVIVISVLIILILLLLHGTGGRFIGWYYVSRNESKTGSPSNEKDGN